MGRSSLFAATAAISLVAGMAGPALAQDDAGATLEEVVVTATRSESVASRVPISIAAYTPENMERLGVRQVDDLTRITPGVNFRRFGFGLTTDVSIRGIESLAGSATTGVYIDDTPIQVRAIGNSSANAYPAIFDLERVEVLRGPQGTLFGAGSEGGTIRFISPKPSLQGVEGNARGELASTKGGALSAEFGAALSGALVEDKLGMRISIFARRDGGFVDRIPYPAGVSSGQRKDDSNSLDTKSGRIALTWQASENVTVSPSLFIQDLRSNGTNQIWLDVAGRQLSDVDDQKFVNGDKIASTNHDYFALPALAVRWDLGWATLASDTSYFHRRESGVYDYGAFINNIFGSLNFFTGALKDPTAVLSIPNNFDIGRLSNGQDNFTQEFRLSSNDPDAKLTYVLGVFYTRAKQRSHQDIVDPYFEALVGIPVAAFYGVPRTPEGFIYVDNFWTTDKQLAAFGEVNYEILDGLKLTAGVRVAKTELTFRTTRDGPAQDGPGADAGEQSETPVTPKFGVSYQINPDHLLYATATKGFRIGGVNRAIPTNATCAADLALVGLTKAPTTYDSDTVWSYEVGSKNRLFDGRMRLAASAYQIKWENIIRPVGLPNCGFAYTDNLGSATVNGFDLQVDAQPVDGLTLSAAVGYNKGEFDKTIAAGPTNLVTEGYTTGGAPWVVTLSAQYEFTGPMGLDSYVRADYNYRSQNKGLSGVFDPTSIDYDPTIPRDPATEDLRLRAGVRTDHIDASVFVNNATNESYALGVNHVTVYGQIFQANPVRPVTAGVTLGYRF